MPRGHILLATAQEGYKNAAQRGTWFPSEHSPPTRPSLLKIAILQFSKSLRDKLAITKLRHKAPAQFGYSEPPTAVVNENRSLGAKNRSGLSFVFIS